MVTSADECRARAVWREGEAGKVPSERPEGAREEREAFTRLQTKCFRSSALLRELPAAGQPSSAAAVSQEPRRRRRQRVSLRSKTARRVESRIWAPRAPAHGSRGRTRCGPRTRWSAARPEKGHSTATRCPRTSLRRRCRAPDARPKEAPGTPSTRVVQNGPVRRRGSGARGAGVEDRPRLLRGHGPRPGW